ncbi:ABC transporter ATP-binding protein [Nereida ignava]|uniref:ABC transporter ATP-binding protein n=1 Tax=Nereida ignava TaxID=282199 RepID=UPI003F6A775B
MSGGADLCTLSAARRDRHRAEYIGLIFQQFNLLPYASVTDNILLPLRFAPKRRGRVSGPLHEAARLCAALGIDEALLAARAGSLSVGQQQRVAAARALIGFPQLIIADEPTSALDAASQETFLSLLFDQARTHNSAVMMVSHDARLAPMFDRVLQMDDIAQTLPPPPQKMRSATKPEHNA